MVLYNLCKTSILDIYKLMVFTNVQTTVLILNCISRWIILNCISRWIYCNICTRVCNKCTRVSIVRTCAYTYLQVEPYSINIRYLDTKCAHIHIYIKPYSINIRYKMLCIVLFHGVEQILKKVVM